MKHPATGALLALGILFAFTSTSLAGDVEDVKALHEQAIAAFNAKDADKFTMTAHDEFVGFDVLNPIPADMKMLGRAAVVGTYKQNFANLETVNVVLVNPQYRVFGNTAIAWGHQTTVTKAKDAPVRGLFSRYTVTYAKQDGKWTAVSYHVSRVPSDTW